MKEQSFFVLFCLFAYLFCFDLINFLLVGGLCRDKVNLQLDWKVSRIGMYDEKFLRIQ